MIQRVSSLSLAISLCLSAATLAPEPDQKLAHDIYKQLVEIKSAYTTGSTTLVAEAIAARLRAAGFPASDIFVGGAAPNKFNIVVRYHGTGARKPILLLAHEDVVEAKREDWTTDTFQFIEKDGYYYGRGTADDKAQAAVWIANLIRYKREAYKPDRDIIVALTADEEGGGPYSGIAWLLKNRRDLIDAEFCLNEGARVEMLDGKYLSNDLEVSEKWYVDFHLEVHNKGGHSSLPDIGRFRQIVTREWDVTSWRENQNQPLQIFSASPRQKIQQVSVTVVRGCVLLRFSQRLYRDVRVSSTLKTLGHFSGLIDLNVANVKDMKTHRCQIAAFLLAPVITASAAVETEITLIGPPTVNARHHAVALLPSGPDGHPEPPADPSAELVVPIIAEITSWYGQAGPLTH
jgi:hypothetical protein